MSTLKTGTVQNNTGTGAPVFKNSSGTEIGQLVKVWVNFDGTGTIAIRDSFNVSSLIDNGTGDYTINFTNAMADTNYAVALSAASETTGGSGNRRISSPRTKATTSHRISCNAISNNDAKDCVQTNMVIFGA
jgi:hypothetical protein